MTLKIPFTIASKYSGKNVVRYVQDLYAEIDKTLLREIKIDLNKWGIYHVY